VQLIRGLKGFFGGHRAASNQSEHLALGKRGERIAREYLTRAEHYSIVAMNVEVPLGRSRTGRRLYGEIDIIAYDRDRLVFVEVKTRRSDEIAAPLRNVDLRKRRQIARAARRYRHLMKVSNEAYRFDVVTVLADEVSAKVELLRGYFDDTVFMRSRFFKDDFF
jgi:putative endonuclease